ncbi:MAG TPA: hypothetical protein VHW09_26340 [Bryobacteraceae bacterium]|jgi:hypothetical protein|nr:hypothetical protein [Bryobacteraceae bacterium]
MKIKTLLRPLAVICLVAIGSAGSLGLFEANSDIGTGLQPGALEFDAGAYHVTGGGADMWGNADAFHFVWKKMSGDVSLTAEVKLLAGSTQEKRKAALMIRQSLDANSAYVDIAFHGNGEVAAQWRMAAGEATADSVLPHFLDAGRAQRIHIERHGDTFTVSAGDPGGPRAETGHVTVNFQDPVYVGFAVCSHDAAGLTKAVFSHVAMKGRSAN